jgi:hypothetical protein
MYQITFLLLTVVPLVSVNSVNAQNDEKIKQLCLGVAEGYAKNRELFTEYSCRYTLSVGKTSAIDEAIVGKYDKDLVAAGVWLVLKEKYFFSLKPDMEKFKEFILRPGNIKELPDGKTSIEIPFQPMVELDDGKYLINLDIYNNHANIMNNATRKKRLVFTPFDMGIFGEGETRSPDNVIREHVQKGLRCNYVSGKDSVCCIELYDKNNQISKKYYFDKSRNYAVSKYEEFGGRTSPLFILQVLDNRKCDNGGWVPFHAILIRGAGLPGIKASVNEITVQDFDLRSPNVNLIKFALPENCSVHDGVSFSGFPLKLTKPEEVDSNNLEMLFNKVQKHIKGSIEGNMQRRSDRIGAMKNKIAQDQADAENWYGLKITLALLCVAGSCYLYFKAKKYSNPSGDIEGQWHTKSPIATSKSIES